MMEIPSENSGSPLRIIAVHGGAGIHARSQISDAEIKKALRMACTRALARGDKALQGVVEAVTVLEDEECLNAGYGSNLTLSGDVECDASIMDGNTGDFGAVGAVGGAKNPIALAHKVLQYSRMPDPLGRIPPLLLVSKGAEDFARIRGMTCSPESMITPRASLEWQKWKGLLETAQAASTEAGIPPPGQGSHSPCLEGFRDRQDTVGAVVMDEASLMAAGVSSGGLLLKHPGRIGEAAIYGAGCWATPHTACSVSGAGEYITRAALARTVCEAVEAAGDDGDIHSILDAILGEQFHRVCLQRGETSPQAGVLLLVKELDDDGHQKPRLWCAFTTESMAIGYASSSSPKPSAMILRRPARTSGTSASVYIAALPLHH
ncbi:N-terminal nucleophile aminohydrolase [Cubamyces lactineus]|nr:N-terminal nucleophile aminohydrolase [Cubamyces lactineus]